MLKRLVNLFIRVGKSGLSSNCLVCFYQPSIPEELK
ncbi:MAG TPA: cyclic lactone autoinducer peptide [Halanaerobiales bacterium]|nr:cyclic lactone autoinducer peptide [Halanaerobiales bacterium]